MTKFPPQLGYAEEPRADAPRCETAPAPEAASPCGAGERLTLRGAGDSLRVAAGRWVVFAEVEGPGFVTAGVAGPRDALVDFEVASRDAPRLRSGTIDDDRRLPAFVSFAAKKEQRLILVVDATEPVRVVLSAAEPRGASHEPPALVGMPFPIEDRAGYSLQAPHRYQFVRADVATALRAAFKQTRVRFKRNAIAIGDISQWNGVRPATDLGRPRHISHEGGRDVDVALPALEAPSRVTARCNGVLVDNEVLKCAPGTVKRFDALRLAYFLGLLLDGPTPQGRFIKDPARRRGPIAVVETIFTDQVYIDEVRRVLPELRDKRWIHDEAYSALAEEGLLRPSAWHVDHVHIRFAGAKGVVPPVLRFDGEPAPAESSRLDLWRSLLVNRSNTFEWQLSANRDDIP
jgi:hypothetical protein